MKLSKKVKDGFKAITIILTGLIFFVMVVVIFTPMSRSKANSILIDNVELLTFSCDGDTISINKGDLNNQIDQALDVLVDNGI